MRTDDLNFDLPAELIAQVPVDPRPASRLLHYRRSDASISHRVFSDLPALLQRGDLLVFNDARVISARFMLRKNTGGRVEGLFLSQIHRGLWRVMLKNVGAARGPMSFVDAPRVTLRVIEKHEGGQYTAQVDPPQPAIEFFDQVGRMPLPPYIRRAKDRDARDDADRLRYQTVYAKTPGAVAAPTAGLHFDEALLHSLDEAGIERTFVTLHVGLGTFKPVETEQLADHAMHSEAYSISAQTAERLNAAKRESRRIIAVGTTSARVLESQPADAAFVEKTSETSIFIYPLYQWKHVDALITNFHLPRSTLIALVAAMTGLAEQRRIYQTAIDQRYRFFSYGDAMLIE